MAFFRIAVEELNDSDLKADDENYPSLSQPDRAVFGLASKKSCMFCVVLNILPLAKFVVVPLEDRLLRR